MAHDHRHHTLALRAAAALCAVALSGCATMQGPAPPDISLVNLKFREFKVLESTVDLEVRLSNENPEEVVMDGGVLKLYLNGAKIGKGMSSERVTIPRLDSVTTTFEIHISHLDVIKKFRSIQRDKKVAYALKGSLYILKPSGSTRKVAVAQEGDFDMERDFGLEGLGEFGDDGVIPKF